MHAATLTWDANTATAGAQDGSGTWSTTGTNWWNGTGNQAWTSTAASPDVAAFGAGGTSGTVTTSGALNVGGLTFNQSGYLLNGTGTLNFAPVNGSVVLSTAAGTTSTVDSAVNLASSTTGLQVRKTGAGTLVLSSGGTSNSTINAATFTITGGTYDNGSFNSILSVGTAARFGTAPAAPTPQIILDAGTFRTGVGQGNANVNILLNTRLVQVNAAGGAIIDGGTSNTAAAASTVNSPITNNADPASSALYLSNGGGIFTNFTGVISGPGSVVWNGPGTGIFSAANTYTGATIINAGAVQLTSSLSNTAISVAPRTTLSPTVTTSAGLSSGAAGASLTLGDGAALDLSSTNAGTINTFTLNPGTNTFTGQSLRLVGAALRFDVGNGTADQLLVNSGSTQVSGLNSVRVVTGGTVTPGAYPVVSAPAGGLTGTFRLDGAATLTVPATSLIKLFGSTFYRLSLQNTDAAEQVVVATAPANVINEMPMGSSITEGISAEGVTYTGGGYRSQLYQLLVNDGRFTPNFVGSATVLDNNAAAGYNVLSGANQLRHEGHSGYTTTQILTNLNANAGTGGNNGGFWLAPGNGVNPDYVTLSIGGNDYANVPTDTQGPVIRTDAIVSAITALRPNVHIVLANLFYRTQVSGGQVVGDLQNTYYNPAVAGVIFNHVLAGQRVSFSDSYSVVTPNNNASLLSDGIHPFTAGYNLMASSWYNALAFGSAYWTGGQDGQWSTITAGSATNFAQNYALTTPRQNALDANTDVHFNNNTAALDTTLGQDIAVRGINFTAGAAGPVSVGGGNTLTLGVGGMTAQAGTGAHTLSTNVVLGIAQTWGNVSSNPLTVNGTISGNASLTLVGAYTVQIPNAAGTSIAPQTYRGSGSFVFSGANTYTGVTTLNSGMLVVSNTVGSGTGSGNVIVANGARLTNNGSVAGNVLLAGNADGNGNFGAALTVGNTGVLTGAGTINGPLAVVNGGQITLSGGTLTALGGVTNNGVIRLGRGATLAVNGGTFTNNGTLDALTGSFSAPGGFVNNGVVLDSSLVKTRSVALESGTLTVTIDSYTGHSYQLQRSDSLTVGTFTKIGTPQNGVTGSVLTFSDTGLTASQGFYRVQVDP